MRVWLELDLALLRGKVTPKELAEFLAEELEYRRMHLKDAIVEIIAAEGSYRDPEDPRGLRRQAQPASPK